MLSVKKHILRKRRSVVIIILLLLFALNGLVFSENPPNVQESSDVLTASDVENGVLALDVLHTLEVKGRAPKTDYSRSQFSDGWANIGDCDVRNLILQRDLESVNLSDDQCIVLSGILNDPYSGKQINFLRGSTTSGDVQIDHVVALSDAWQKGAQQLTKDERLLFANDSLNLLAVDGLLNQKKGNSDAASWLPPNKHYRCRYVARQIAVKQKYTLWITEAEKSTMKQVLNSCPTQLLPVVVDDET